MQMVEKVEKLARGTRRLREELNLSQAELSEASGIAQQSISELESGRRLMGRKVAKRLAEHLPDAHWGELLTQNRLKAYRRAKKSGDRARALLAVKGLVEALADQDPTTATDEFLEELVDDCLEFVEAKAASTDSDAHEDGEEYDEPGMDGRNTRGKFVGKKAAVKDHQEFQSAFSGVLGGGSEQSYSPEDYMQIDDGRDPVTGHRIVPLDEVDEDGE